MAASRGPSQRRIIRGYVNQGRAKRARNTVHTVYRPVIPGDTGHLTFGRSQTTLGSGNLHALIGAYCDNVGARFGERLAAWLPQLQARDTALDRDPVLHNVLRASADDSVMRETQDVFFDQRSFQPAMRTADRMGITPPLGRAVVYDSHVHGSWATIRNRVDGTPASRGERPWVEDYVTARRAWLAGHRRPDLRTTAYRMDAFARLIAQQMWGLELPLVVRGVEVSTVTLAGTPPRCYDGPPAGSRVLAVTPGVPLPRGPAGLEYDRCRWPPCEEGEESIRRIPARLRRDRRVGLRRVLR